MGRAKNWTAEELSYLSDRWGQLSITAIAKHLGRSVDGVKIKAGRMGLGDNRFCMDVITLNQLSLAIGLSYSIVNNWVKRYGFPAKTRVMARTRPVLVVEYDDFWKWAEQNRHLVDFKRIEPNILGHEPQWVKDQRRRDFESYSKRCRPWTPEDDSRLKGLVRSFRYTYPEIARMVQRSEGAVKRRLYDLGLKYRPVRLNNHIKWTDLEVKRMVEMYHNGYSYNAMAAELGKSALGIRGKLERMGYKFRPKKSG